jgi:hypothetical protein
MKLRSVPGAKKVENHCSKVYVGPRLAVEKRSGVSRDRRVEA